MLITIMAALVILLGFTGFTTCSNRTKKLDRIVYALIRKWNHPCLELVMKRLTMLGYHRPLVAGTSLSLIILIYQKLFYPAILFLLICFVADVTIRIMKRWFKKPRPIEAISQLWDLSQACSSFPSGHASSSLLVYGFLAYLLTQIATELSGLIIVIVGGIITLIGVSRVYLGMHWPTDVVAGYGVGALFLSPVIAAVN